LGITAFGAYSVGRQNAPASNAPVAAMTSPSVLAKPVAFNSPTAQAPAPVPIPPSSNGPVSSTKASLPDGPAGTDTKRKVETALTAAAIAAIIVQAAALNTMLGEGPAPVQMTPCETAEPAEAGAHTRDRAGLRRFAIRAT
jgi:hypothetical protein